MSGVENVIDTSKSLTGRVGLVTGGGRGMGAAIAHRLASDGADVVVTYTQNEAAARGVADRVRALGVRSEHVRADAADPDQVREVVDRVVTRYGGIDILVNNAGVSPQATLTDTTDDEFEAVVGINLRAPFIAARAAARVMGEGGRIINIGSVWGERTPFPGIGLYAMSKFGLAGFTRAWSRDLGSRGITVNCVQPGPIDTEMNPADGEMSPLLTPATGLGRYGTTDEVAAVVAFLAGPASGYVTGAIINVDGGFNA